MRSHSWFSLSSAAALALSGCANNKKAYDPNDPLGTGPFDAHGNYVEEWADDPAKWRNQRGRQQQPPVEEEIPQIAKNEEPPPNSTPLPSPRPKPPVAQTAPKPAPKPVSKPKPKPKPKPKSTTYVVKKGDTLSGIASRYRSSVAAIRRANGISGSLIRPGQRLVVPTTR